MKIRKRYFVYSAFIFLLTFGLMILYFYFLKGNCGFYKITKDLANKISEISITFSLTMLGFLIASFSLIQLIQTKDWYETIYKSKVFQSFIHRLWLSIIYLIIDFVFAIISYLLISILPKESFQWIVCFLLSVLLYILSWITFCMIDYIRIVKD